MAGQSYSIPAGGEINSAFECEDETPAVARSAHETNQSIDRSASPIYEYLWRNPTSTLQPQSSSDEEGINESRQPALRSIVNCTTASTKSLNQQPVEIQNYHQDRCRLISNGEINVVVVRTGKCLKPKNRVAAGCATAENGTLSANANNCSVDEGENIASCVGVRRSQVPSITSTYDQNSLSQMDYGTRPGNPANYFNARNSALMSHCSSSQDSGINVSEARPESRMSTGTEDDLSSYRGALQLVLLGDPLPEAAGSDGRSFESETCKMSADSIKDASVVIPSFHEWCSTSSHDTNTGNNTNINSDLRTSALDVSECATGDDLLPHGFDNAAFEYSDSEESELPSESIAKVDSHRYECGISTSLNNSQDSRTNSVCAVSATEPENSLIVTVANVGCGDSEMTARSNLVPHSTRTNSSRLTSSNSNVVVSASTADVITNAGSNRHQEQTHVSSGSCHTHSTNSGVILRPLYTSSDLPDVLHSHVTHHHNSATREGERNTAPMMSPPRHESRRTRSAPRLRCYGDAAFDEMEPKGCCGVAMDQTIGIRWFVVFVGVVGLTCVVIGIILGILGGLNVAGSDFVTIALLLIGVGMVLTTVSGVAWRLTSPNSPNCSWLLGFQRRRSSNHDEVFTTRRWSSTNGRGGHPFSAMMYPEFEFRSPPPSYQASMQDYRLRLMWEHNNTEYGYHNRSPPPTYRSVLNASRPPLEVQSNQCRNTSLPPSYRSHESIAGVPATRARGSLENVHISVAHGSGRACARTFINSQQPSHAGAGEPINSTNSQSCNARLINDLRSGMSIETPETVLDEQSDQNVEINSVHAHGGHEDEIVRHVGNNHCLEREDRTISELSAGVTLLHSDLQNAPEIEQRQEQTCQNQSLPVLSEQIRQSIFPRTTVNPHTGNIVYKDASNYQGGYADNCIDTNMQFASNNEASLQNEDQSGSVVSLLDLSSLCGAITQL